MRFSIILQYARGSEQDATTDNLLTNAASSSVITSATALQQLHWLPIKQRIHFKIATVTYRILQTGSPAYLSPFINLNTPSITLRSASHNFLHVGRKAFRYAAPTVWNSIAFNIRHSPSIGSFKHVVDPWNSLLH